MAHNRPMGTGPFLAAATLVVLAIIGCGSSSSGSAGASPTMPAVIVPTVPPGGEAHPVSADEAAKEIGFPLMPKPLRPPLAMLRQPSPTEKRYEIDQVPNATPAEAADYYSKELGLTIQKKGESFDVQGQTKGGDYVLMHVEASDGKTVVGTKIIHYSGTPSPNGAK